MVEPMQKRIVTALVVVAILVAIAPLPKHVGTTPYTTDDELTTVLMDVWCLQYLLTENKLLGTITVAAPSATAST